MRLNIIKIGGNIIDSKDKLTDFLGKFSKLEGLKILIHGGGKIATKMATQLGIETQMIDGRRITDQAMIDIVTMVYGGLVNKQIVASLQGQNCNSIGLTGADGAAILAEKRPVKTIDYGFVGDVIAVNSSFIASLLHQNITPIFAPLTFDKNGQILNTNADTQASEIAKAMAKDYEVNLVYCFEKKGVLSEPDNDESVIAVLTPESYESFKNAGVINEGMIPKLDNAFNAVASGVKKVIICHADHIVDAIEGQDAGTVIKLNQ